MRRKRAVGWVSLRAIGCGVLALSGCVEYSSDTTVRADGSGIRREELRVYRADRDPADSILRRLFGELASVTAASRWIHGAILEDGDTVHRFRRETGIEAVRDWTRLSNTVRIAGATVQNAPALVGTVRLGDVQFRNDVLVEVEPIGRGRAFTYRETYAWENLTQVLVEYLAGAYVKSVTDAHPSLSQGQRSALLSQVTGSVWLAVGQGLFDATGGAAETVVASLARTVARQTLRAIGAEARTGARQTFATLLRDIYDDEDAFEQEVLMQLPGARLAFRYEMEVRVKMPGVVTATNAHRRDGDTLVWEFTPGDALTAPVELVAQSVVDR